MPEKQIHTVVETHYDEAYAMVKSFECPVRAQQYVDEMLAQQELHSQIWDVWDAMAYEVICRHNVSGLQEIPYPTRPSVPNSRLPKSYRDECAAIQAANREKRQAAQKAVQVELLEKQTHQLPQKLIDAGLPSDAATIEQALKLTVSDRSYRIIPGIVVLEDEV